MFQCILTRWVHCLHKAISLTGKQFINFQGVWDGFNCCFSKSLGKWTALHFLPNSNYPLPAQSGFGVWGKWWQAGWEERYWFAHHFGPWDTGRRNREKLVLLRKSLRRIPFEFLQPLFFFRISIFHAPCKHSYSRVWLLPFSLIPPPSFSFAVQLQEHCSHISLVAHWKHLALLSMWPPTPAHLLRTQSWCALPEADFLVHENNSSFLGNSLTQIYTDIILSSRTVSLDEILHRN